MPPNPRPCVHLHHHQVADSENSQKTDVTQPASQPSEASGSEDCGPKPSSLFTLGSAQVQTSASEGDASAEVDEGEMGCGWVGGWVWYMGECESVHVSVCVLKLF